jgi:hypothetical protein
VSTIVPEGSTAELLGGFYKELQSEGLTSDQAFELVRDAAKAMWAGYAPLAVKRVAA